MKSYKSLINRELKRLEAMQTYKTNKINIYSVENLFTHLKINF